MALTTLDGAIIGVYFLALLIMNIVYSKKKQSSDEFFLAQRSTGWLAVAASFFASNIGSDTLVGLSSGTISDLMLELSILTTL